MNKVLIIDDEPSMRFSLQRALSSSQTTTLTADTAKIGIQRVKSDIPDLVLLDVRLPDMSGLDALQAIRDIDQRLPIIVITAHGTPDTAIEATKRGAFDYLLKPFELPRLREAIQRGLEAGRLARRPAVLDTDPSTHSAEDRIVGRKRRDARGVQSNRKSGRL
ncbi:MAG: response regulator [Pirellulales bacterium]